jgi:anti-sigma factor RsiW
MSCSPYDLRDYLFQELTPAQEGEVRLHLKTCAPCTSDLEALRATHAALLTLREEEMPQRIGFVSDKVFEPSPLRRWFSGFWNSTARIGFVSSAMLSAALLVYALRPAPVVQVHNSAQSLLTAAEVDRRIQDAVSAQVAAQVAGVNAQVEAKIAAAVTQAVAETEERAQKRTNDLLASAEKRFDMERWALTVQLEQSKYDGMKKNAEMVRANLGSSLQ